MTRPTKDQIKEEIAALKALQPIGRFAEKTKGTIDLVVDELEHGIDQTSEEWTELSDEHRDAVLQAEAWKRGLNGTLPSTGWEGLVK